jgi:uncharacterized protein (TIGR03435 family)
LRGPFFTSSFHHYQDHHFLDALCALFQCFISRIQGGHVKKLTVTAVIVFFAFKLAALGTQSSRMFEVASIKPYKPLPGSFSGSGCRGWDNPSFRSTGPFQIGLGRCRAVGGSLVGLIKDYFGGTKEHFSVSGLSAWMNYDGDQFVIEAKAEDGTQPTSEQLREMMQTFIVQQFHLKYHREMKEVKGYDLVVAKDGPKWTPLGDSEPRTPGFAAGGELTGQTDPARLARVVSGALGVPVSDRTGLSDRFVVALKWAPQETDRNFTDKDAAAAGPSIFAALQEQLGLRLAPAKVSVEVFVIDSAERPVVR